MSVINELIDKLTNSIENVKSGEIFRTQILPFLTNDKGFVKAKWVFDWKNIYWECYDYRHLRIF